jgi:hypothetical protein
MNSIHQKLMPKKNLFRVSLQILFVILVLGALTVEVTMLKTFYHFLKTSSENHTYKDHEGYVNYRHVFPKNKKTIRGSVFIFPPTGGENIIDRLYAKDLAALGFEVFILQDWSGNKIEGYKYELHNIFYSSAQKALEKISNLAVTNNFGILGTSVGALHASITLTTNPRFQNGFLIVGGLSIPEIIVSSNQPAMQILKEKRYQVYHLENDTQYLNDLSQIFAFEPTKKKLDPQKKLEVGMIISTNDKLVPFSNQKKAVDFFNSKTLYLSDFGHRNTIAYYGLLKRSNVTDFFTKRTYN